MKIKPKKLFEKQKSKTMNIKMHQKNIRITGKIYDRQHFSHPYILVTKPLFQHSSTKVAI